MLLIRFARNWLPKEPSQYCNSFHSRDRVWDEVKFEWQSFGCLFIFRTRLHMCVLAYSAAELLRLTPGAHYEQMDSLNCRIYQSTWRCVCSIIAKSIRACYVRFINQLLCMWCYSHMCSMGRFCASQMILYLNIIHKRGNIVFVHSTIEYLGEFNCFLYR